MKFKFIFSTFFAMFSLFSIAQQINNTEFKTKTLQVFQNLDKSRVPHGILLDFGMEFTNIQAFNGTVTDSTYTNSQTMSDIYKTLLMCRVRNNVTTGFITPEEYATRWYSQRTNGIITLSGQYFKYNRFADNAYPSKLNYSTNKFSDKFIGSAWQNPYEEKQLFAMSSSIAYYRGLNFKVKLPSNLFLTNYPALVQNIQIDFSDGLGYRIVSQDQLVDVNYTQANNYTWKYKISLTNGQTLLSHSKIEIEEGLNAQPFTPANGVSPTPGANTYRTSNLSSYYKTSIIASTPYNNWYGSATVYIRFANGNTFTKPLIVAEGFDTGIILKPEQEAGDNNIDQFLKSTEFIRSNSTALEGEIDSYDIIYVDWNNGVDFLQRNAFVLEEVIKWVNLNKTGTEQNVVLGQSMGGLIARYALKDMENKGLNHDTRLYVSHDAPQLGANTPLSVQYSARHLRNVYINTPIPLLTSEVVLPLIYNFAEGFSAIINFFGGNTSVDPFITPLQAFSLADVPAARQMQYTWVSNSGIINNTIHDAWQQELANIGYPAGFPNKPIRNIAIANGSECGVPQVNNGNIMSYIKDAGRNTFLSNYIGVLDAVYGTLITNLFVVLTALFPGKSYWQINFQSKYMTILNENKNIYQGSIKYKKKVFWFIPVSITITEKNVNQPAGILPYDIYGGGQQRTSTEQLPLSGIVSNSFGFIPTASALDVGKGTTLINDFDYRKTYVGALPPALPKNSPFQNFVTHFDQFNPNNNNSSHISFNRRNGNWLRAELNLGIADEFSNCSYVCANVPISGASTLCDTATYTAPVGGTNFFWSVTQGANLVTLTGNGTPNVTLTAATGLSGQVTLTLNMSDNGNCGNVVITKSIWVGVPKGSGQSIIGAYDNVPVGSNSSLYISGAVAGATSYYWQIVPTNLGSGCGCTTDADGLVLCPPNTIFPSFSYGSSGSSVSINWGNCAGSYIVNLYAVNECGTTGIQYKIFNVFRTSSGGGGNPCTPQLTVYPNPVKNGIIEASIAYPGDPCNNNLSTLRTNENVDIEIYDLQNNKVVSRKFNKDKINISDANLKKGHYILIAKLENEEPIKKIIIIE